MPCTRIIINLISAVLRGGGREDPRPGAHLSRLRFLHTCTCTREIYMHSRSQIKVVRSVCVLKPMLRTNTVEQT